MGLRCGRDVCGAHRFPTGSKAGERQVVAACKDGSLRVNDHVGYAECRKLQDQIEADRAHLGRHDRRTQCDLVNHICDMRRYDRASVETESEDGLMTDGKSEEEGVGLRSDPEHGLRQAEETEKGYAENSAEEEAERDERVWQREVPSPGSFYRRRKGSLRERTLLYSRLRKLQDPAGE